MAILAGFAISFAASDESEKTIKAESPSNAKEQKEVENTNKSIYQITDIEELRHAINHTVWTHTTRGDQWLRYEFVGNKIKQYSAFPKYGKWVYDGESQYSLSECHTQYEGRKFFVATFKPKTKSLAMFDIDVVFNFEDYHLYLNGQNMGGFVKDDYEFE